MILISFEILLAAYGIARTITKEDLIKELREGMTKLFYAPDEDLYESFNEKTEKFDMAISKNGYATRTVLSYLFSGLEVITMKLKLKRLSTFARIQVLKGRANHIYRMRFEKRRYYFFASFFGKWVDGILCLWCLTAEAVIALYLLVYIVQIPVWIVFMFATVGMSYLLNDLLSKFLD